MSALASASLKYLSYASVLDVVTIELQTLKDQPKCL